MDSTKKEQLAFGCKDYVEMINTQFNNILNMLYSDAYKDKDHIPSLNGIYSVYTSNSRFDNVLFNHMTFPTFLAILIDTDINSLDNYMKAKSPIFNTNRFYMNDFQNIELVRLYLEEIIFTFLSSSPYLGASMLVEIFNQFKNISHGSYSYIYKYADYCIDLQSIIYDSDLFKNAHNLKSEIRLISEDISKIILDESYKKSIERFTEYATVHHTLDKYIDASKIDISSKKQIEDDSVFDFDKSEIETNEKCGEKIENIIAPEDGFISSVDTNNKFFDVKFVRSVAVCSDTAIGTIDGMRIEYCDSKSIFKNCKIVDIKCEVPFDIVVGREFKKGDILLKQIICNETEQSVICEPSYINPLSYKLDGTAKTPEASF